MAKLKYILKKISLSQTFRKTETPYVHLCYFNSIEPLSMLQIHRDMTINETLKQSSKGKNKLPFHKTQN